MGWGIGIGRGFNVQGWWLWGAMGCVRLSVFLWLSSASVWLWRFGFLGTGLIGMYGCSIGVEVAMCLYIELETGIIIGSSRPCG